MKDVLCFLSEVNDKRYKVHFQHVQNEAKLIKDFIFHFSVLTSLFTRKDLNLKTLKMSGKPNSSKLLTILSEEKKCKKIDNLVELKIKL